jgi:hypothetical protein
VRARLLCADGAAGASTAIARARAENLLSMQ